MSTLRASANTIPVSDFKAHAAEWLQRIAETGQAVVITQHGKPAGVLLSPAEYERLTEHGRFVTSVSEGLRDAEAGRLWEHADVVAEMKKLTRRSED